jgi:uncharacterized coiled-coil DUF342 family protein
MDSPDFKKNREGLRKIKELTEKISQPVVHSDEEYNRRLQDLSKKLQEKQDEVIRLAEELEKVKGNYEALKQAYVKLMSMIVKRKKNNKKK